MNFLFIIPSFFQVYRFALPFLALDLHSYNLLLNYLFHFSMQLIGPVDFLVNLAN